MSEEQSDTPSEAPQPAPGDPDAEQISPEQEEMLRQMEEEMRKVRVQDLVAQSVVSILNLSYRRIAKEDERDLEQARVGIEAIRGMVEVLDPESQREIKNALSQVQVLYAQQVGESGGGGPDQPGAPAAPRRRPAALTGPLDPGFRLRIAGAESRSAAGSGYAGPAFRSRPGIS